MENTDINNNNNEEVKPRRVYTEAQIRAVKAYHEKQRDSEEFKQKTKSKLQKSI
jgi:hypothetical protein